MKNRTILKIKIQSDKYKIFRIKHCYGTSIDWGNGNNTVIDNNHIIASTYGNFYTEQGEYIVTIYDNTKLQISDTFGNDNCLIEVVQISELITDCVDMFNNCHKLTTVNKATLPPNCTNCSNMFIRCKKLTELLPWGKVTHLDNCKNMYCSTSSLKEIRDMIFPIIICGDDMFNNSKLSKINNVTMRFEHTAVGLFQATKLTYIDGLDLTVGKMFMIRCGNSNNRLLTIKNSSFTATIKYEDIFDTGWRGTLILENSSILFTKNIVLPSIVDFIDSYDEVEANCLRWGNI